MARSSVRLRYRYLVQYQPSGTHGIFGWRIAPCLIVFTATLKPKLMPDRSPRFTSSTQSLLRLRVAGGSISTSSCCESLSSSRCRWLSPLLGLSCRARCRARTSGLVARCLEESARLDDLDKAAQVLRTGAINSTTPASLPLSAPDLILGFQYS